MSYTETFHTTDERIAALRALLENAGAAYSILLHEQNVVSAEDGAQTGLGGLEDMAPTFILHTEAGYLAAIVRGDTRLSYKKIKKKLGLKNVSLASPEEVKQLTGSEVGWVSLINRDLQTIVDERLTAMTVVYGGTGVSSHTLRVDPGVVVALTEAQVFDFTELK